MRTVQILGPGVVRLGPDPEAREEARVIVFREMPIQLATRLEWIVERHEMSDDQFKMLRRQMQPEPPGQPN